MSQVRPLLVVGRTPPPRLESLTQLLVHGCVEYVDAGAVDDATFWVATDAEALAAGCASAASGGHAPPSHLELHPALFLSLPAASIPFAHHNQSTRNNFYASSQFKQAVGVPHPAWLTWRTMSAQALMYPQRPLVTTAAEGAMRAADLPAGVNALMMIGYLDGYNQEDALVANARSMELGMFHSMQFDAYSKAGVCPPAEEDPQLDEDGTAPLMCDAPSGAALLHDEKAGVQRQALRTPARVEGVVVSGAHTMGRPHRATVRVHRCSGCFMRFRVSRGRVPLPPDPRAEWK